MADTPPNEQKIREELKAEYDANLQEELTKVRKMFESELATLGELDPDDPATASRVRSQLLQLVPDATQTLSHLLNHGNTEGVRAGIAKFVFTEAIGSAKGQSQEDELRDLLKTVAKKD